MKSHIQITKGLLKRFSSKAYNEDKKPIGQYSYYLELDTNKIKYESINDIGSEKDYYTKEIEQFLNTNIEKPFGEVASKVRDFERRKIETLSISEEGQNTILEFFNYSLIRSDKVLEEVNKHSIAALLLGGLKKEALFGLTPNFFKDMKVNILLNRTKINFVIPKNCFYAVTSNNKELTYVLPFTPRIAFILLSAEDANGYIRDGKKYYSEVHEQKTVEKMNIMAYETEKQTDNGFIVSQTKEELITIQDANR